MPKPSSVFGRHGICCPSRKPNGKPPLGYWLRWGDTEFLRGSHEAAREALSHAMHCPDAIGNPFLHLRPGQAQFELGNFERAADELIRAYALGEEEMWAGEDPKYLDFLATVCEDIENYSRKH